MGKANVQIIAKHDLNGNIQPITLIWNDGRQFSVDRVLDVRMMASLKAGGQGMRYKCRVAGKEIYLFCDEGKWFIEMSK